MPAFFHKLILEKQLIQTSRYLLLINFLSFLKVLIVLLFSILVSSVVATCSPEIMKQKHLEMKKQISQNW